MKCKLSFILLWCVVTVNIQAQEIPVNMHTGTPSITIPLHSIVAHDLSEKVEIFYNSSGVKLEQRPEFVGLGWGLRAGGRIVRDVRGLPDDFDGIKEAQVKVNGVIQNFDSRRGWLLNISGTSIKAAKSIGDFIPTSDLSATTCSDETADFSKFQSNGYAPYDTEPDLFYISCSGLSGSFVFDNSSTPKIKLIPLQDVKIEYTISQTTQDIIAFTVTNNQGHTYYFDRPVAEKQSVTMIGAQQPQFFYRFFNLYSKQIASNAGLEIYEGHPTFNSQWMLTKIKSPSGAEITFQYSQHDFEIMEPLKVGIRKDGIEEVQSKTVYDVYRKVEEQRVNTISSSSGQQIRFNYFGNILTNMQVIDSRKASDVFVKEIMLSHSHVASMTDSTYKRVFLKSLQERSGCNEIPPYTFSYNGVNFTDNTTTLPKWDSNAKDFWGYYNGKINNTSLFPTIYVYPALNYPDKIRAVPITGYNGQVISLPGADRTPDPVAIKAGTLATVNYPFGGSLIIDYEPNTYFDEVASQTYTGAGLRVRAVIIKDGVNVQQSIYKELSYEEQPGQSSGRLLSPPAFYVPASKYVSSDGTVTKTFSHLSGVPAQELWSRLLVRTEINAASESAVRYQKVTVKRPGSGRVAHEFSLPVISGSLSNGEWIATENKFSRSSLCETMGIMNEGGSWRYPFAPNPNFNYEQGLQNKKSEYNEQGTLVQETIINYQYLYRVGANTPSKVWGLNFEKYPNTDQAYLFGKYFLLTDVTKVPLSETVTTYDEINPGTGISQTTIYNYESTLHRLLTKVETTNSDGIIYGNEIKYPLDFGVIPTTTDKAAAMISKMQNDFRNGIPVETLKTLKKPGETKKVLQASLIKMNDFGTTTALPEYSLSLNTNVPLTNFVVSKIQLANGQQTFVSDSRYEIVSRVLSYEDNVLVPKAVENSIKGVRKGTVWGHNASVPVAEILFAEPEHVAFSDFETTSSSDFLASASIFGSGRTGIKALHPSILLSKIVNKGGEAYVLSFWIKTDGTALNFNIVVKDVNNPGTQYYSNTFAANSSSPGIFTRIEKIIPASNFPSSFKVEFKGQITGTFTSSPSLLPVIDDVAFYPEDAELTTFTYQLPFGVSSQTDFTGKTTYQTYDGLGRIKLTLDHNNDIRTKNTYRFSSVADVLTASFRVSDHSRAFPKKGIPLNTIFVKVNQTITFVADEDCHDNVQYEWDFGNGYIPGSREHFFVFPAIGLYPVKLRVSKPGFATAESSTINISAMAVFPACAEGVQEYNPSTNQVVNSFPDCTAITGTIPTFATAFKLQDATPGTISWKLRDIGSQLWSEFGSTQQVVVENINQRMVGFEVMCEMTYSNGTKMQTEVMQVLFTR